MQFVFQNMQKRIFTTIIFNITDYVKPALLNNLDFYIC